MSFLPALPAAHRLAAWVLVALVACANSDDVVGDGSGGDDDEGESCGNGACEANETCSACAPDCCALGCGDGICDDGETCLECPEDCGGCPACGDRVCAEDEACGTCPIDCGDCDPTCGDGACDLEEDCASCAEDCGRCSGDCGDGTCDSSETCQSCAVDCGNCPPNCGNDSCDANESCTSCPVDCGPCQPTCGDGTCGATETCQSCPADCGACPPLCGNNACDASESCETCSLDCGICPCLTDEFEPNNGSPSATPVSATTMHCDLSICTGDIDWLEFSVTSGFTATITFSHAMGDLELEIYSGQTLAYVTGSYGGDDDETVTKSGVAAGLYWARIFGAAGATNPDYCFQVTTF